MDHRRDGLAGHRRLVAARDPWRERPVSARCCSRYLTFVELALFLFFAALSAASTVAQEKDRRTFILLLMTDLRNDEIVLGKLLGSLLPIAPAAWRRRFRC